MKKRNLARAIACALLIAGASHAAAQELNYSYLEGGVSLINLDEGGFSETEVGFNIRGSLEIANGFYLQGAWDRWDIDVGPADIQTDLFRVGAGYHWALQDSTDLFVEGSYARFEVGSGDDDGFRADIGLRHGFNDRMEGRFYGGYQGDGSDGDVLVGADVLFKFTEQLGISVGAETFEFDANVFRGNLRVSF